MLVLKFGGTSVGSPQRMREVAELIHDGRPKIVVLSAVSGTTNKLVSLSAALREQHIPSAQDQLDALRLEYAHFVADLLPTAPWQQRGHLVVQDALQTIAGLFSAPFDQSAENIILAQGELISTQLFQLYLQASGIPSTLLPALDFMRTDIFGEPDLDWMKARLPFVMDSVPASPCYITQGYICRNANDEIDNLQRGGSDYTATLIGAALQAEEIQIWTDIDGLHNNDPRIVKNTHSVPLVSFREAAELAYFGAKILHPTCIIPAEEAGVPVRLLNTFIPEAPGTLIATQPSGRVVAALAAKDGICAIKIRSGRMLNAYGFLRQVFEVFERFRTPIDMITTSEVSVSLTIDKAEHLPEIVHALSAYGDVHVDSNQTIICIVGDQITEHSDIMHQVFASMEQIPIRMVSYGGSSNNISLLIPSGYKADALQSLHQALFPNPAAISFN
ncbi:MAG: aspartate kinase [Haliscomenobacter sp.]